VRIGTPGFCARIASMPFANPATPAVLVICATRLEPARTGSWVKRSRSWPHHAISRASVAPDPGFRQPSFDQPGFGKARTAAAMAIENSNWAHIKHPWHVTIGPPRAPTLSGLAHCDGSLGVGE